MSRPRRLPPAERRKRDLAAIHASKKQLGLDDDTYRDLVERVSSETGNPGVRSSAELTDDGRRKLLEEMRRQGAVKPGQYPGRPKHMPKGDMMKRVEQLLTGMGLPWSYADTLAKHMYRCERVAWLKTTAHLRGIIAALDAEYHRRAILQAMTVLCVTAEQIHLPKNWRSDRELMGEVLTSLQRKVKARGAELDEGHDA